MIYISVVSFAIGILIKEFLNIDIATALFVGLVSVVAALVLWKDNQKLSKLILIICLSLSAGTLRASLLNDLPDQSLSGQVGKDVVLYGRVTEESDKRDTNTRYTVQPLSSKSRILLVADRFPKLKYGDEIKVSGRLDVPKNFENDVGVEFDYVSYLRKDNIHFLIYYPEIEKIGESKIGKIISGVYSIKHYFISKIERVVPEPNSSLLSGMIFGVKQSLGTELLDQFKKVGLIHIVVLSGQNITIIASSIFLLVSLFLERNKAFALSAVSIILFALMVGFSATVVRASIMAVIAILARYLGRPEESIRWLFIAGLLMIIWNPMSLPYDPSFQLSFLATFGLIIFTPVVSRYLKFLPTKFEFREIVSSTIAVQIFILPMLIKMSGQVSLISFLINPTILPLVPLIMLLGAVTGFLGLTPIIGFLLSWPVGILSYFLTQIIIKIVEWSSNVPFSNISVGSISITAMLVWYAVYLLIFIKLKRGEGFTEKLL